MAQKFATDQRAIFIETSARLNKGVNELFHRAAVEGVSFSQSNQPMQPRSPRRRSIMYSNMVQIAEEDEDQDLLDPKERSCCSCFCWQVEIYLFPHLKQSICTFLTPSPVNLTGC